MISGNFVCPAGVTKICAEIVGHAADGGTNFFDTGGGGGGGGAYVREDNYVTVPTVSYPYTIADTAGESSTFPTDGNYINANGPNTWVGGTAGKLSGSPTAAFNGGNAWFSANDRAYGRGAGGGARAEGPGGANTGHEQTAGLNADSIGGGGDGGNFDAPGIDGTGPGAGGGGAGGLSGGVPSGNPPGLGQPGGLRIFDNSDGVGYPACATAERTLLVIGSMPPLPPSPSVRRTASFVV